jgi:hypothetical protein
VSHGSNTVALKVHRYQLPTLDGELLSDPEQMKEVGAMTQAIGAKLKAAPRA